VANITNDPILAKAIHSITQGFNPVIEEEEKEDRVVRGSVPDGDTQADLDLDFLSPTVYTLEATIAHQRVGW
jgi:hypothetical protein